MKKVLIIVIAVLGIILILASVYVYFSAEPQVPPVEFTVGTTELYPNLSSGQADRIRAVKHLSPNTGRIKSLHIYIESLANETQQLRLAVYRASDLTLLYDSGDIDIPVSHVGWVNHNVAASTVIQVVSGQSYYIAQMSNSATIRFHWLADVGVELALVYYTYGSYPATLALNATGDDDISMYILCEE